MKSVRKSRRRRSRRSSLKLKSPKLKSLKKSRRSRRKPTKQSVKKITMNFGMTKENWILYSKQGCPYCQDAKNLLLNRKSEKDNVQVTIIDKDTLSKPLDVYKDGKLFETWPRIFLNGEFIGGFGDLKNKFYS